MTDGRGLPLEVEPTDVPVPPELYSRLIQTVADSPEAGRALYNVLRIHRPEWQGGGDPSPWAPWQTPPPLKSACYECGSGRDGGFPWPCPTVLAIADELGVPRD